MDGNFWVGELSLKIISVEFGPTTLWKCFKQAILCTVLYKRLESDSKILMKSIASYRISHNLTDSNTEFAESRKFLKNYLEFDKCLQDLTGSFGFS